MSEPEPNCAAGSREAANPLARRLAAVGTAVLLAVAVALAACDNRVAADGNANGSGARGHVKLGLPF